MEEYDISKTSANPYMKSNFSGHSRSWSYKADKNRDWRRKKDRYFHHVRRKTLKEGIILGANDSFLNSSTTSQHRKPGDFDRQCLSFSNKKVEIGYRPIIAM